MTGNGDWIEWDGGECPVEPGTRVEVRYRPFHWERIDHGEYDTDEIDEPEDHRWTHKGLAGDFIAYRLVKS